MEVYYGKNFWGKPDGARAMREYRIDRKFLWGDLEILLPAVYIDGEGLAVDFCIRVPDEAVRSFWNKWEAEITRGPGEARGEQILAENPLHIDFGVELYANGLPLKNEYGCGACRSRILPPEIGEDLTVKRLAESYGCADDAGWCFRRQMCSWSATPSAVQSLDILLTAKRRELPCDVIGIEAGCRSRRLELRHPKSGDRYELTICRAGCGSLDAEAFGTLGDARGVEYPGRYFIVSYEIAPELSDEAFELRPAGGDRPRRAQENAAGAGGCEGATSVFIAGRLGAKPERTASALYFEPVERALFRPVFMEKEREDMRLQIELPHIG